jgi:hypothetical protein
VVTRPTATRVIARPRHLGAVNPGEALWRGIDANHLSRHCCDNNGTKLMSPNIHLTNALTLIKQGYCLGANAKDS